MKNLAPQIIRQRLIVEGIYTITPSIENTTSFLKELSHLLDMEIAHGPLCNNWAEQKYPNRYPGVHEAWVMWVESGTQLYIWKDEAKLVTIDIYSCKPFDVDKSISFIKDWFKLEAVEYTTLPKQ